MSGCATGRGQNWSSCIRLAFVGQTLHWLKASEMRSATWLISKALRSWTGRAVRRCECGSIRVDRGRQGCEQPRQRHMRRNFYSKGRAPRASRFFLCVHVQLHTYSCRHTGYRTLDYDCTTNNKSQTNPKRLSNTRCMLGARDEVLRRAPDHPPHPPREEIA